MASFLDSSGVVGAQAASGRDPTSAVRDELALLIDGATNYAIYLLDPDGRVTIWNRGAERIKGWTAEEVVGQNFAIFYPLDEVEAGKPQNDLLRASSLGRFEEDGWRLRKDGSEFLAKIGCEQPVRCPPDSLCGESRRRKGTTGMGPAILITSSREAELAAHDLSEGFHVFRSGSQLRSTHLPRRSDTRWSSH